MNTQRCIRNTCRIGLILIGILICTGQMTQGEGMKSAARLKAEMLVEKGIALSDGSPEEEQYYLKAYRIDPSYAKPLFDLGLVYTDRLIYEIALTYLEQYEQFRPGSLEVDHLADIYRPIEPIDATRPGPCQNLNNTIHICILHAFQLLPNMP